MDVVAIETGRFKLDGGAMFGVVPKNLWNRTNPADEENRIDLALRTLLVRSGDRLVLIDTGVGSKLPERLQRIYGIDHSLHTLEQSLAIHGHTTADVTDVIITHLHFDHAGGAVAREGREFRCTFPNARYYVQRTQWEWALDPSERDRASYMPENYLPLRDHGVLELVDGAGELIPGISLLPFDGHTFGQQGVTIRMNDRTIFYCADLIPTATHITGPYIMGYDLQPLVTLTEKNKILEQAVREEWLLFFEHDPLYACATVTKVESRFQALRKGALGDFLASSDTDVR